MNNENTNPEAVNPAAAEPAAPAAAPTAPVAKKPWYKRTSVWCGITLTCAAVAGIAAWIMVGGDAAAAAADTATDAATDAVYGEEAIVVARGAQAPLAHADFFCPFSFCQYITKLEQSYEKTKSGRNIRHDG